MNMNEKLFELLNKNPGVPIGVMYPSEKHCDYDYAWGEIREVKLNYIHVIDDRIFYRDNDEEELREMMFDNIYEERFPEMYLANRGYLEDEELCESIEKVVDLLYNRLQWTKEITITVE